MCSNTLVVHLWNMCITGVLHLYCRCINYMCNTPKTPHMYYIFITHVIHMWHIGWFMRCKTQFLLTKQHYFVKMAHMITKHSDLLTTDLYFELVSRAKCIDKKYNMWYFHVEIGSLWDCEYKAWTNLTTFFLKTHIQLESVTYIPNKFYCCK